MNTEKNSCRKYMLFATWVVIAFALVFRADTVQAQEKEKSAAKVTFEDHVKPILVQRCSSCHNAQKREGDLDVTNYVNLMQGGGSGSVIEPQDASGSFLFQLITHEDSPEMPPSGTKIPDPEIQMISAWIEMGALENKGSKAAKPKPSFEMAVSETPTVRPDKAPVPLRMPVEPVLTTVKPSVITMATSPWAPLVAVATPKQVLLYDTQSLQLVGVLPMEEGLAHSLRFSRNGQLLLAGGGRDGAAGKAILWNVITGERITTIGDELDSILAADISSNHEWVALGGPSKVVKIYSTADGAIVAEINKHTDWITALEFSPDGKFLATGDRNGGLNVWEPDTGSEIFSLKGHSKAITEISWRADSKVVASASEDTTIRTWEMENGKQIKSWGAHGIGVTSIEFQRDGHIVSCGRDKVAKVWDQAGKVIRQFPALPDVAVSVSYCDETKRVLASDWSGELVVWNAVDGVQIGKLAANPPALASRLAAAEKTLVANQQKHAPLAAVSLQTKTKLDSSGAALVTAKANQTQIQVKLAETEKSLAARQQMLKVATEEQVEIQKELGQKIVAHPMVKASLEKVQAALAALPADEELKKMVASLDTKNKQLVVNVGVLQGKSAISAQAITGLQTEMDTLGKSIAAAKLELTAVNAKVASLQTEVGAITEKLKTDTLAETTATALITNATNEVARWKSDIAFIAQLKTLFQKLDVSEKAIVEKQAVVNQAQASFNEARQRVDQANSDRTAVQKNADDLKVKILKLRGG